jgi:colanic acid/amylovoran biosynthesis protein
MNVLVEGVSVVNRGSELMLAAIAQHMQARSIDVAIGPSAGPFRERTRYGLLQEFDVGHRGRLGPVLQQLMRPAYRRMFGLVTDCECAGLLDASGFALGDQWPAPARRYRKLEKFRRFQRASKSVVLLPQAFGPFQENIAMKAVARDVVETADLVYARDESSLAHLREIVPDHPGLRLAPDFTALVEGLAPCEMPAGDAPAAVIPNTQMVVHGDIGENGYLRFLIASIQLLRAKGLDPFLLLHESSKDRAIAAAVLSEMGDVEVVEHPDGRVLKGIIGRCVVTIGSRFHGLVSALSQGVPSVGTGWSHKYRELFADYGCSECLMDIRSDRERLGETIAELVSRREDRRQALLTRAVATKAEISSMWSEVDGLLTGRSS